VKRALLAALVVLLGAYGAFGASARHARSERRRADAALRAEAKGELRGAYHVHTTASDGRGTLADVVRAAREAGLEFVVVTDHNVRTPERPAWVEGVLVVPASEASTPLGHVIALGVPRALSREERESDPLGAIRALGGEAVLAHPLHPERPFTGWARGPWRGFEVVSDDTAWHRVVADHDLGRALRAALVLPWDRGRAELALADDPADELARFDVELRAARAADPRRPARVLFCSVDAHGYPSYAAAFEGFSMRVPVAATGDAERDARAVTAALTDGSASCVMDAVAPAARVRLAPAAAPPGVAPAGLGAARPAALDLTLEAPRITGAEVRLLRDGELVFRTRGDPVRGGAVRARLPCVDGAVAACPPGDYRAEVRRDGRPWIFTNPVSIE
jgi:hypothetical protein